MESAEYKTLFEQEETHCWYRALRRLAAERTDEALGRRSRDAPEPRILDAGCGTGGMLRRLQDRGAVQGLDVESMALRFACTRGRFPLTRGSVGRLPYRPASFDLVISLDVIYHRAVPSDLEALMEFRRVLSPDGVLILNLPAFESLRSSHDRAVHTARRYTRAGLTALLKQAGFRVERMNYWNSLLLGPLALLRLGRRSKGKPGSGEAVPASDVVALPGWLNWCLGRILAAETLWLRRFDFPAGLSLMAVARPKREDE
jgi:SAM-dependent methyltransferase